MNPNEYLSAGVSREGRPVRKILTFPLVEQGAQLVRIVLQTLRRCPSGMREYRGEMIRGNEKYLRLLMATLFVRA